MGRSEVTEAAARYQPFLYHALCGLGLFLAAHRSAALACLRGQVNGDAEKKEKNRAEFTRTYLWKTKKRIDSR
jgi:hypothetical protein